MSPIGSETREGKLRNPLMLPSKTVVNLESLLGREENEKVKEMYKNRGGKGIQLLTYKINYISQTKKCFYPITKESISKEINFTHMFPLTSQISLCIVELKMQHLI